MTIMATKATILTAPVICVDVSFLASTNNPNTATHAIAPAAKPNPMGSNGSKYCTAMNAGTAISGCGNEVNIAHNPALNLLTFFVVNTSATASPSGTLCTANVNEIAFPTISLLNDTPIPIPSVNECNVITNIINMIFCAFIPSKSPNFKCS
jgi:hypothetical protein